MAEFYSFLKSLWVLWMALLFVGIVVWVLLPRNRARFRHAAQIPLDDAPGPDAGTQDPAARTREPS